MAGIKQRLEEEIKTELESYWRYLIRKSVLVENADLYGVKEMDAYDYKLTIYASILRET